MIDFQEHHASTRACVVAFASGGEDFRHETPAFEWKRTLDGCGVSYILMRDSTERWYQDGVQGIGDRMAVVSYLRNELEKYEWSIGLGLSSGAYGALLFGQLVPMDEVIAISPLTVLGPRAEKIFGPRWSQRVRLPPHQAGWDIDLGPFYAEGPIPRVRAYVSNGDGAELDQTMANIIGIKEINYMPGHSHAGLAKHLVDVGIVRDLLVEHQ